MSECIIKSIKICSCKINHFILSQCLKCTCWYTCSLFLFATSILRTMVQRNMPSPPSHYWRIITDSSWNVMAHSRSEGETREWSGKPVPFTLPRNMVYPALLPLMHTPRLPVVDWTDAPSDLNGLVRFTERQNLVFLRMCHHISTGLYQ